LHVNSFRAKARRIKLPPRKLAGGTVWAPKIAERDHGKIDRPAAAESNQQMVCATTHSQPTAYIITKISLGTAICSTITNLCVMLRSPLSVILSPRNKLNNHQPDAVPIRKPDLRTTTHKRVTFKSSCIARSNTSKQMGL
jgi:hypothetical protein